MLIHPALDGRGLVQRSQTKVSRTETGTTGKGHYEENKTLQKLPKVHIPPPLAVDDVYPS
jgi:hypothetical protein